LESSVDQKLPNEIEATKGKLHYSMNTNGIFCSDLDKIEIALPKDDGGDYELMFNEGPIQTQKLKR
jgi:hypothetical protein